MLLLLACWGIMCHTLRFKGINYMFILALPLDSSRDWILVSREYEQSILRVCMEMLIAILTAFIAYSRCTLLLTSSHVVSHAIPTLLLLYIFYRVLFPPHLRRPWLLVLQSVLYAPFGQVGFREGFVGDLLTSTVRLAVPLTTACIYTLYATYTYCIHKEAPSMELQWWHSHPALRTVIVPLLTLYPLWIRLMQCLRRAVDTRSRWPHYGNACKYASAMVVSGVGVLRPDLRGTGLWVTAFIASTLFQYSWDITMDWGLIEVDSGASWRDTTTSLSTVLARYRLRTTRLLGESKTYLTVACVNLVLRFAWSLTLLPQALDTPDSVANTLLAHMEPLLASVEIARRMLWGVLRIEWEQIEVHAESAELDVDSVMQLKRVMY